MSSDRVRTGFDNGLVIIDGPELQFIAELLIGAADEHDTVRIAIDGGLKVKLNDAVWSPAIGRYTPGPR